MPVVLIYKLFGLTGFFKKFFPKNFVLFFMAVFRFYGRFANNPEMFNNV